MKQNTHNTLAVLLSATAITFSIFVAVSHYRLNKEVDCLLHKQYGESLSQNRKESYFKVFYDTSYYTGLLTMSEAKFVQVIATLDSTKRISPESLATPLEDYKNALKGARAHNHESKVKHSKLFDQWPKAAQDKQKQLDQAVSIKENKLYSELNIAMKQLANPELSGDCEAQ